MGQAACCNASKSTTLGQPDLVDFKAKSTAQSRLLYASSKTNLGQNLETKVVPGFISKNNRQQQQSQQQNNQSKRMPLKVSIAFKVRCDHDVTNLGFAQNRFLGFRNHFEFDQKRLVLADNEQISYIGYDQFDKPFLYFQGNILENINTQVADDEKIVCVEFVYDQVHEFILLVTQLENDCFMRILYLKDCGLPKKIDPTGEEFISQATADGLEFGTASDNLILKKSDSSDKSNEAGNPQDNSPTSEQKQEVKEYKPVIVDIDQNNADEAEEQSTDLLKSPRNDFCQKKNVEDTIRAHIAQGNIDQRIQGKYANVELKLKRKISFDTFSEQQFKTDSQVIKNMHMSQLNEYKSPDGELFENQPELIRKFTYQQNTPQPSLSQIGKVKKSMKIGSLSLFYTKLGSLLVFEDADDPRIIELQVIQVFIPTSHKRLLNQSPVNKLCFSLSQEPIKNEQKITNFRTSKKCEIELREKATRFDFYSDTLIVTFKDSVELYDAKGNLLKYLQIDKLLRQNTTDLKLKELSYSVVPRVRWSGRNIESIEKSQQRSNGIVITSTIMLKKLLVIGTAIQNEKEYYFFMIYNFQRSKVENIKLLDLQGASITCVKFGPFDNGYLLLGLSSGALVAMDLPEIEVVANEQLFEDVPITNITYEPTNLVFASSKDNQVVAINLLQERLNYVYMEIKNRQYTMQMPISGQHDTTRDYDNQAMCC